MSEILIKDVEQKMINSINHLIDEFSTIRTGRANPSLVDKLNVEYYGTKRPLQQLATISVPDPKLLVIQPFDKTALEEIEKSVLNSDIGLNPTNDGEVIRIPIPPLSEERRKELGKVASKSSEDAKVSVRSHRRFGIDEIAKLKDENSADEIKRLELKVQELTDKYVNKIDELLKQIEEIFTKGPEASSSNWDAVNKNLKLYNLQWKECGGDGHCQFKALAQQLNFVKDGDYDYEMVREDVAKELKRNQDRYIDFLSYSDQIGRQVNYDLYVEKIHFTAEWGDDITLQAAANYYNRTIYVVGPEDSKFIRQKTPKDYKGEKDLWLGFVPETHYRGTTKLDENLAIKEVDSADLNTSTLNKINSSKNNRNPKDQEDLDLQKALVNSYKS